jgi:8-oxo-dGTP pyrophosphatase MutT (NUDIX family)
MAAMTQAPEHACAILVDPRGWLLLQLRPTTARNAPDRLGCFGGKREGAEDARACLDRELREELGWQPRDPRPVVELRRSERWIATFFVADIPDEARLTIEAGSYAVRAPLAALPGLPVTSWHAAVITAWRMGQREVAV